MAIPTTIWTRLIQSQRTAMKHAVATPAATPTRYRNAIEEHLLMKRNEEQDEPDEHEQEVRRQVRDRGGEVTAGRDDREERDERDHGKRVQTGEEDERDDRVAVGRVPAGADVALQAEDVGGGGE